MEGGQAFIGYVQEEGGVKIGSLCAKAGELRIVL